MAKAYLRICINVGKEKDVRDALRKEPEVLNAEITAGEQDCVALVERPTYEDILNFVVNKVRVLDGIKITWTNFVLD